MAENLYYGRGKDEDNKKLIAFLDEVFFWPEDDDRDFLHLLPKCYKDQYRPAYNNFVVQDENGEFRSAIGSFYNDMIVADEPFKTCCIGNVAVGKDYRGNGYMKELLRLSVDAMAENGTDIAYLGGQRQRYGFFGFETAGTSYNFGFSGKALKHSLGNIESDLEVTRLEENDIESIKNIEKLYSRLPVRSNRPLESYFDVLSSWRDETYILKENGKFIGYFIFNHDLSTLCEWDAIDADYFPRLVMAAAKKEGRTRTGVSLIVAPFETEKLNFCTKNADSSRIDNCEMILVYHFKKAINAYLKAKSSYAKLCDGEMTVLIRGVNGDEKIRITVKDNVTSVEDFDGTPEFEFDHHTATRIFFSNFISDRAALPANLQQWFPLHLYLSPSDTM